MSAYGHQMEREYSARSLSSREDSERGSGFVETGIYMSSFATTVFLAGLVTVGVSLLSLLIALTAMLQSCETRNAGLVEMPKSMYDYDYCKIVAFHAELNGLDADSFPVICKDIIMQYIRGGQYMKDLNATIMITENYLSRIIPMRNSQDVVIMDVDDFFPSVEMLHRFNGLDSSNCLRYAKSMKHMVVQKLYLKLLDGGWPLVLLSAKPERLRNTIEQYLATAGCHGWSSLIMRTEDELQLSTQEYFFRQRINLLRKGCHVVAMISSQMDAMRGPHLGGRIFKLPDVNYIHNVELSFQTQSV